MVLPYIDMNPPRTYYLPCPYVLHSINPHNNHMMWVILPPFFRWKNWSSKTKLVSSHSVIKWRRKIQSQIFFLFSFLGKERVWRAVHEDSNFNLKTTTTTTTTTNTQIRPVRIISEFSFHPCSVTFSPLSERRAVPMAPSAESDGNVRESLVLSFTFKSLSNFWAFFKV